jgi:hypothetical protein
MYRKDLEVGWPQTFAASRRALYLCLAGGKRGVEGGGAEQSAASSSRSAFRILGVAAIGQRYNRADEDLLLEMSKVREWGGVDWGVYALGGRASCAWI